MAMTRAEAISYVKQNEYAVQSEFAVSRAERDAGDQNCREALLALGCTPEEIDAA